MAPSCNQRHNVLPLGTPPGRCVGLAEPDRGCSNAKGKSYFAGSSQARALTCTTSSGGKVRGRPGRSGSSNPARRSIKKRLRQSETTSRRVSRQLQLDFLGRRELDGIWAPSWHQYPLADKMPGQSLGNPSKLYVSVFIKLSTKLVRRLRATGSSTDAR